MRILFSPCHYVYDEESVQSEVNWTYNLVNRIAIKNKGSVVITGYKNLKKKKPYKIIEAQKGKRSIDMSLMNALKFNIQYFNETRKVLKKEKIDILHHLLPFRINSTFNLYFIFFPKKIPYVIGPIQNPQTVEDDDLDLKNLGEMKKSNKKINISGNIYNLLSPVLKLLSSLTLKKADRLIVINQFTKDMLVSKGINKNRIVIIPPGIDINTFHYTPYEKKQSEVIQLITVSYLVKRKAIDLILKALAEVVKKEKNIKLTILGSGPQLENLQKLSKDLKITRYVSFVGKVPYNKLGDYYKAMHIYVGMSKSEGFANASLEAMAVGFPIISSRVGGFSELVTDGINGFIVEQGDYKELARKILYLLQHKEKISEFSKNARKEIEKNYDWENSIIPSYLKIYNALLKKS